MVSVPNIFATTPAVPNPSAALLDQNFAALVAAINAIVLVTGQPINPQTGVAYTVQAGDLGKLVTLTNGSAIALTLPQAIGAFTTPFFVDIACLSGSTGAVTITPTTSTINGVSSLVVPPGKTVRLVSDGTNWQLGINSVSGTMTLGAENVLNPYATSAQNTVAHGLPRTPDYCFLWLQNLSTELGYAPGDRVPIGEQAGGASSNADVNVVYNATNTIVGTGSTAIAVLNRSTFGTGAITAAKWKVVAQPVLINGGAFV